MGFNCFIICQIAQYYGTALGGSGQIAPGEVEPCPLAAGG